MTEYDKFVRDRVPEIVRENGETPVTHVAEGEKLARLREAKADERGRLEDGVVLERVE